MTDVETIEVSGHVLFALNNFKRAEERATTVMGNQRVISKGGKVAPKHQN